MSCVPNPDRKTPKTIEELEDISILELVEMIQASIPTQLGNKNYRVQIKQIVDLITKDSLGLGNVDNTADKDKPLSDLMTRALYDKANKTHSHVFDDIEGLSETLETFFSKNDQIPVENLVAIMELLAAKAELEHRHSMEDVDGLMGALAQKAEVDHTHSLFSLEGFEDWNRDLQQAILARPTSLEVIEIVNASSQATRSYVDENFIRDLGGSW